MVIVHDSPHGSFVPGFLCVSERREKDCAQAAIFHPMSYPAPQRSGQESLDKRRGDCYESQSYECRHAQS